MEFTVIGDTVNRVARLCDAAKRDEILISKILYNQFPDIANLIEVELRPIETKKVTDPDKEAYSIREWKMP